MTLRKLLIANRGEIAIRIARAAAEHGIESHAVFSEDDGGADHARKADVAHALRGHGPAAYLDGTQLIQVALAAGCEGIHPGYGFLSENATFARQVENAGLSFIGPTPTVLETFGDKSRARALAAQRNVPILAGTQGATSLEAARDFMTTLAPDTAIMVKAIAGGGGRGMRPARTPNELPAAFERCASEARQAFGNGDLYVEAMYPRARHIEVQVIGDGSGAVTHLWERECSLQRNRQKLVEIAPAPRLAGPLRDALIEAALSMARAVKLRSLATFEFLVASESGAATPFVFIEANPRLQVEHTVTEAITGIDLVRTQIAIAEGQSIDDLELTPSAPRGMAIQLRLNAESIDADGTLRPDAGTLLVFDPPAGPGVRVDTCGHTGFRLNPRFDTLLAKIIVHTHAPSLPAVLAKGRRALSELRLDGIASNQEFLLNILAHKEVAAGRVHTTWVEQ
ncbi:MAG: carbamoyl-phosphate synthase large subunit, partial [Betaproteobacteria bacterium]|nr:carbamoyl-phosphate synthase large subunit [Betaproteobacteria bacterium]